MKAIFPDAIDGDLLKLVHLSNGFRMVDGAAPLAVGDKCSAEARVVSVVNSDSGKTVKVKGYVVRDGKPVVEVTSAFLYRGRFTDYQNTFSTRISRLACSMPRTGSNGTTTPFLWRRA